MAITKRIAFNFTGALVIPTEEVKMFTEGLVEVAQSIIAGRKVAVVDRMALEAALEGGVEAALEFYIMRQARAGWSEHMDDIDITKCSPLNIRFIK